MYIIQIAIQLMLAALSTSPGSADSGASAPGSLSKVCAPDSLPGPGSPGWGSASGAPDSLSGPGSPVCGSVSGVPDSLPGPGASVALESWLAGYEIPANDALSVTPESPTYEGRHCHTTVQERYGDTKAALFNLPDTTMRIVVHTFRSGGKVVSNFTLLYDKTLRCARWVAFRHNNSDYPDGGIGRKEGWSYDPALPQTWQPCLSSAYPGKVYDRGHQAASNDRQTTPEQNAQTFYYSNMTPQLGLLNRGQWQKVEKSVQAVMSAPLPGCDSTAVFVVTGPLFYGLTSSDSPSSGDLKYTIDRKGSPCAVPDGYFKCYMSCGYVAGGLSACKGGAWIVRTNSANIAAMPVSIDEVESVTGYDFFPQVPDSFEIPAEK